MLQLSDFNEHEHCAIQPFGARKSFSVQFHEYLLLVVFSSKLHFHFNPLNQIVQFSPHKIRFDSIKKSIRIHLPDSLLRIYYLLIISIYARTRTRSLWDI